MPARTMTQSSQGSQAYPPGPRMGTPGPMRSFTPMSRIESPGPRQPLGPRMPIAMTSTPPPSEMYQNQPAGMPTRQNTPDAYGHMHQDSNASFNRPPPISRMPTPGSVHHQDTSISRPDLASHVMSFNRPFSPPSEQQPLHPADSYEMTPQPYMSQTPAAYAPTPPPQANPTSAAGGYVAFNPIVHSASSTPVPQERVPQRSATAMGSHVAARPPINIQRSATAPAIEHLAPQRAPAFDNRGTIGYSDIVDDYGRETSISPPRAGHMDGHGWPRQY